MVTWKSGEAVPIPQEFVAVTIKLPEVALPEKLTVIALVFGPDCMVAPEGTVHTYPVAPVTGAIE
jgi:hypothetical protein